MKELLLPLMLWLGIPGGPPPVQFVTIEQSKSLHPDLCSGGCAGYYSYATGTITLTPKVDLTDTAGRSVLLHELRHWQQHLHCGPAYTARQWDDREHDAFCVQYKWLREQRSAHWVVIPGVDPEDQEQACANVSVGRIQC